MEEDTIIISIIQALFKMALILQHIQEIMEHSLSNLTTKHISTTLAMEMISLHTSTINL